MADVIDQLQKLCIALREQVRKETQAIEFGQWDKMEAILHQKEKLLEKLQKHGLNNLNKAGVQDERVQFVKVLMQDVMDMEQVNTRMLKDKMSTVQGRLARLKKLSPIRLGVNHGKEKSAHRGSRRCHEENFSKSFK